MLCKTLVLESMRAFAHSQTLKKYHDRYCYVIVRRAAVTSEEALYLQFNVKNIERVLAEVDYRHLIPIAVQLGLEREISEIEDEIVPEQRRLCLARKWLSKRGEGANWEALATALCHEGVGENEVARHIEDRYMRRGSRTSSVSSGRSSTSSPGPLSPPFYAVRDLRNKEKGMAQP